MKEKKRITNESNHIICWGWNRLQMNQITYHVSNHILQMNQTTNHITNESNFTNKFQQQSVFERLLNRFPAFHFQNFYFSYLLRVTYWLVPFAAASMTAGVGCNAVVGRLDAAGYCSVRRFSCFWPVLLFFHRFFAKAVCSYSRQGLVPSSTGQSGPILTSMMNNIGINWKIFLISFIKLFYYLYPLIKNWNNVNMKANQRLYFRLTFISSNVMVLSFKVAVLETPLVGKMLYS